MKLKRLRIKGYKNLMDVHKDDLHIKIYNSYFFINFVSQYI